MEPNKPLERAGIIYSGEGNRWRAGRSAPIRSAEEVAEEMLPSPTLYGMSRPTEAEEAGS
jgi:hypothetical protein